MEREPEGERRRFGLPNGVTMVVGRTVADATPVPDAEHDEWAWWPADVERWPAEAGELARMGRLLGAQAPATPTGQDTPVPPRPQ